MRSEPAGPLGARPLSRLAKILAEAGDGTHPTPVELAELLWLARQMADSAPAPTAPDAAQEPGTSPAPTPSAEEAPPENARQEEPRQETEPHPPSDDTRVPLHLPASAPSPAGDTRPHASLLAPAPPMLRGPLALQRALRPLKRRSDAPVRRELDERATAHRIAHLGGRPEWWLPVMRPARERWLSLRLVRDTGPTMPVWHPLIRELHTTLAQSGVFRTVTTHRARPDGTVTGDAGAHVPTDGRTVTLLVSDCMGPQWWAGPAGDRWYATLRRWSQRMPLALVQPLPERLWRDTALPTTPGLLSAPFPAAPPVSLAFTPYDTTEDARPRTGTVPLPVLEPDALWLAHWSALVASQGGSRLPGSVAYLTPRPPLLDETSGNRSDVTRLPAEELVLRFRAGASPEAFRLAGHLAVGPPHLPVMRLVQAAVEPHPRPQHLAEIILSGMLTTAPGPPGSYAFRPGVRDLLLRGLPRTAHGRTTRLLARVGASIDERAGRAAGEFRASTPMASGTEAAAASEPIATVSPDSARRLLGTTATDRTRALRERYRFVEQLGSSRSLWRAEDTESGRTVVVRLYPSGADDQVFLRDARTLAGVDHPNVVKVHDYGVDAGTPYAVMEHVDGISLNSLTVEGIYRIPAPLLVSLGRQLADALRAVHEADATHGGLLDMAEVLILPDGTAKITLFHLQQTGGQREFGVDLRALGRLLFRLSSGGPWRPLTDVTAGQLTALPDRLRRPYASALHLLLTGELTAQRQGAAQLWSRDLALVAKRAHTPLHYSLLGPPTVTRGTAPVATGSPQEQAMLCVLLLRHGRAVTHTELAEGIWGGTPPERAQAVLGTYASRLRNALGPGALATLPDGYALHTSADVVDVVDCRRSMASAEAERRAGRPETALAHVNNALSLWYGTALDGVPGPAAGTARTRFDQLRLSLCATRAELNLDLGEFENAATDLAALVRAHPAREDFRRLHRIALRYLGRTEEAGKSDEQPREEAYDETADTSTPDSSMATSSRQPPGPRTGHQPDSAYRTCVFFDFADGPQEPDTLAALGRAVTRLVTASGMAGQEYQLLRRTEGYTVLTEEGVSAFPLLSLTLLQLHDRLVELGGVRLCVTFWRADARGNAERPDPGAVRAALDASEEARGIVAVPRHFRDGLREESDSAPLLRPLDPGPDGGPPTGWHRLYLLPRMTYDGTLPPPAVLGPYPLPATRTGLPQPQGRTRTVVYASPDGELGTTPSHTTGSYYEVSLREQRTALDVPGTDTEEVPVFTARGEVTWRVTDPVEAVRLRPAHVADELRHQLLTRIRRLALDFPPSHASQAAAALHKRLNVRMYGCTFRWNVTLSATTPPPAPARADSTARADNAVSAALRTAQAVILGFDGPLAELYTPDEPATVLRELAQFLTEARDPEDALSGQPLPYGDPVEGYANPLDLLRTFARHELADELRLRLDTIETRAARTARPRTGADLLVRTLEARGTGLAVVTDHATLAVRTYLQRRGLDDAMNGGVHGRPTDLGRLMPHPHSPRQALDRLGVPPARCLMIGSTVAEQSVARFLGVPFLAFAPDERTRTRLLAAGGEQILVGDHTPLLNSLRAFGSP